MTRNVVATNITPVELVFRSQAVCRASVYFDITSLFPFPLLLLGREAIGSNPISILACVRIHFASSPCSGSSS